MSNNPAHDDYAEQAKLEDMLKDPEWVKEAVENSDMSKIAELYIKNRAAKTSFSCLKLSMEMVSEIGRLVNKYLSERVDVELEKDRNNNEVDNAT
jgi:hypothetical protein